MQSPERNSGKAAPRRGPKPRLSIDRIVDSAIAQLGGETAELSLTAVARGLGVSPMALYTYVPNRDALKTAVAERILSTLPDPAPGLSWRAQTHGWLWNMHDLLERYPMLFSLMAWEGHASEAWVKAWLPIHRRLQAEGLEGDRLAFATSWFQHAALGLIWSDRTTARIGAKADPAHLGGESAEQEAAAFAAVDRRAMLDFGFRRILDGLQLLLNGETPA